MKRPAIAVMGLALAGALLAFGALACEDDELAEMQTPTEAPETLSETPWPATESMAISVTHEAFLSAAALRSSELPEGYLFPSVEYDDSRRTYRIDWDPDDYPLISSLVSYHESSSAAESFGQRTVDLAQEAGYQVGAATQLDGWVATDAGQGGVFLVATNFAVGRVAGSVTVAGTANVEDIRDLSESLAATVVDRIDDLPLPGEEVNILLSDLELRKIAFDLANKGDDLLRELQRRADGDEDNVTDAYVALVVDCEIARTADFFQLWVLIAPSCTHYLEVRDLLREEGSVGQAIEEVVAANALLDEQLELLVAGSPPMAVTPTTQAASAVAQGLPSAPEDADFELIVAAILWASASDLLMELEHLVSPGGDGSQRDAIWHSFQISLHCFWAEEDFPTLWDRVSESCNEAEYADQAGLLGLVDSERYERSLSLAEGVEEAAIGHLLQRAGLEKPTYELLTTASLTAHAVNLWTELMDLISPEGDSTPHGATLLSTLLAVDCEMAREESPALWAKVGHACGTAESMEISSLIDSGSYDQALPKVEAIRDAATPHLQQLCQSRE